MTKLDSGVEGKPDVGVPKYCDGLAWYWLLALCIEWALEGPPPPPGTEKDEAAVSSLRPYGHRWPGGTGLESLLSSLKKLWPVAASHSSLMGRTEAPHAKYSQACLNRNYAKYPSIEEGT